MGAVGLAVIDPHFVRESNIEDCVIEAVGQVGSSVCREESQILFLERLDLLQVVIALTTVSQAST